MPEPRWIRFDKLPWSEDAAHSEWAVRSKTQGSTLGSIEWFARWRRYVLVPDPECVFDAECLRDIAAFLDEQTKASKGVRVQAGQGALLARAKAAHPTNSPATCAG